MLLFLHDIEAEVRVFRKPRKTLVNDCFITHAAKQFFVGVIEYYDHKCYVCSYAVKAKIRIVLLVNQNEDKHHYAAVTWHKYRSRSIINSVSMSLIMQAPLVFDLCVDILSLFLRSRDLQLADSL